MRTELEEKITKLEKEIREKNKQLIDLRRQLAGSEKIKPYYFFDHLKQEHSLLELFDGRQELIMIHNMGKSCSYCTLWADGFNGFAHHLNDRASFVVCSPDPVDVQVEFAAARNWKFRMYSYRDLTFIDDIGFLKLHEGKHIPYPGVSIFKMENEEVFLESQAFFGPGDAYCSFWDLLDLLPSGYGDWRPKYNYATAK